MTAPTAAPGADRALKDKHRAMFLPPHLKFLVLHDSMDMFVNSI